MDSFTTTNKQTLVGGLGHLTRVKRDKSLISYWGEPGRIYVISNLAKCAAKGWITCILKSLFAVILLQAFQHGNRNELPIQRVMRGLKDGESVRGTTVLPKQQTKSLKRKQLRFVERPAFCNCEPWVNFIYLSKVKKTER